jgi:hypothetical protein
MSLALRIGPLFLSKSSTTDTIQVPTRNHEGDLVYIRVVS